MRESGSMVLWIGLWPPMVGVASTRKPEIVSVLERQVRVMEESFTLDIRTRRGGLMSGKMRSRLSFGQRTHEECGSDLETWLTVRCCDFSLDTTAGERVLHTVNLHFIISARL